MSAGAVEVQEAGRALKVHTHTPHLVSLGGGRLSTAVTLHPLPEGRTTLGSGQGVGVGVDIALQGVGVEPVQCHIDNVQGHVTLVPVAEMVSVDNLRVAHPIRLSQGCMLCLGRSNFLRFNHPAEANLMKSVLPNPRISMLPYGLYTGEDTCMVGGKPPSGPSPGSRGSWESWEGLSSASSEEIARYISPKVFPAGSSTVNSPAALVLGHRASHAKLSLPPLILNGEINTNAAPQKPNSNIYQNVPNGNGNIYQNVYALPNGQYAPRVDSPSKGILRVHSPSPPPQSPNKPLSPRYFKVPSPAFNRNPAYSFRKSVTSPTQSWASSVEDLTMKGEAEVRRRQAENERLSEQEAEKMERQRLDEILMMCADYEKQAQWERLNKPQQNRIITNGSLPRDKRLPSPNSPHFQQALTFTYDSPLASPDCDSKHFPDTLKPHPDSLSVTHPPSSPRTRIRTIAAKDSQSQTSREYALELIENRLAILNDYEILGPPPPPRNSSRRALSPEANKTPTSPCNTPTSTTSSTFSFDYQSKVKENNNNNKPYKSYPIAEANALSKYQFLGFNPRNNQEEQSLSYQHMDSCQKSTESLISNDSKQRDSFQSTSTQNSVTKSTTKIETDPSWTSADYMANNCNGDTIRRQEGKNGEYTTEQLFSQLDAIVRESIKTCSDSPDREKMTPSPRSSERDSGIAETAARDSGIVEASYAPLSQADILTSLRMERTQLVANLTTLKAKAVEIEQQEEELMRELEIERALVGGELQAQQEKLVTEEQRLATLRQRVAECEREMDECVTRQAERQGQARKRLDQQQALLNTLEQQLMKCPEGSELRPELIESCKQQHEYLENERKSFEDLEFSLLEEEAGWLSRREELQREVSESMTRSAERRERLASLQAQRDQAVRTASTSSRQLSTLLNELLLRIDQGRKRLKEIDAHLQNPNKPFKMEQEVEKKQSQDDIERISRVTSGAPIEMSSNSLGRRTIASLQEIERNRQLHLAKQGSQVIEEERQRVSELKRRVQDEARAEWNQRRLRDTCPSEESILSCTDTTRTSSSSENAEKRLTSESNETKPTDLENECSHQQQNHERVEERLDEERGADSRPLSEASTYSEDQLSVRLRGKHSTNLQRPLTRYLPIRGEALDLRQHIESAGHQIDLCPHVVIDKASCRGFLHKMTSRFHNWNKRWFVFDRSRRTLTYYSDRSERKPRGGAYFQAIEEVYVDHSNGVKSPNPAVTFVIKSSERTYHLVAPSPEAMRIWVDVIFTGAEGYQEFAHGS